MCRPHGAVVPARRRTHAGTRNCRRRCRRNRRAPPRGSTVDRRWALPPPVYSCNRSCLGQRWPQWPRHRRRGTPSLLRWHRSLGLRWRREPHRIRSVLRARRRDGRHLGSRTHRHRSWPTNRTPRIAPPRTREPSRSPRLACTPGDPHRPRLPASTARRWGGSGVHASASWSMVCHRTEARARPTRPALRHALRAGRSVRGAQCGARSAGRAVRAPQRAGTFRGARGSRWQGRGAVDCGSEPVDPTHGERVDHAAGGPVAHLVDGARLLGGARLEDLRLIGRIHLDGASKDRRPREANAEAR